MAEEKWKKFFEFSSVEGNRTKIEQWNSTTEKIPISCFFITFLY